MSITFSVNDLLHFIFKNKQFLPQNKKKFDIMKAEDITGP